MCHTHSRNEKDNNKNAVMMVKWKEFLKNDDQAKTSKMTKQY